MQITAGAACPDISVPPLNPNILVIMGHTEDEINGTDAN